MSFPVDNWVCITYNDGVDVFPCSASPIQAVSLGIAMGALALAFTMFLSRRVSRDRACCSCGILGWRLFTSVTRWLSSMTTPYDTIVVHCREGCMFFSPC
jgi:hypothetical protein